MSIAFHTQAGIKTQVYEFCNFCNSNASFESIATNHLQTGYDKSVYILNLEAGVIKKFYVSQISASTPDFADEIGVPSVLTIVKEIEVEEAKLELFDEILLSKKSAIKAASNIEVPKELAKNVYDVVGASYRVNDIADFYHSNAEFKTRLGNYVAGLAALAGKPNPQGLVIPVQFSDNSNALLRITFVDKNGNLLFQFVSGQDADNNTVMPSPSFYANGELRFTIQGNAGVEDLLNAMRRLGVPISGPSGPPPALDCNRVDGILTCIIAKKIPPLSTK